ncbi:unnamed protein product, partial [Urochloa humidicola]
VRNPNLTRDRTTLSSRSVPVPLPLHVYEPIITTHPLLLSHPSNPSPVSLSSLLPILSSNQSSADCLVGHGSNGLRGEPSNGTGRRC